MQTAIEEIITYTKASIVPAKSGRKCVDGRYLPDQATGMIARPGGDCGYVMALLAINRKKNLGLTPEQCFNVVYKVVSKDNGFCMHTDHHADPDKHTHVGLIGCGHLAKAAAPDHSKEYEVASDDVKRIIDYARNIHEISRAFHMVNLDGEHHERGVLIVQSDKYSVLADNPKLGKMYFIYDAKRDAAFIKQLVKDLHIPGVTYEEMKHESDLQLQATLQNLASGLSIYEIAFKDKTPKVTFMGIVEQKPISARRRIKFPHFGLRRAILPRLQRFAHRN